MVHQSKPSTKALGKRPVRNNTATTASSQSAYTPSRSSSALDGEVDELSTPPSVVGETRRRRNIERRVLPTRTRRGGAAAGLGQGEIDASILGAMRRKGENDPLIPAKTVFILTTDAGLVPAASTSEIGFNNYANERFFDRPEVIRAFKEQQDIQIPEFTQLTEEERVGGRLRARSGGTADLDLSDGAYEKRHKRHEISEKRERHRERDQLKYEQFKLKERVESLRTMTTRAFLSLPPDLFASLDPEFEQQASAMLFADTSIGEPSPEGERRRKLMLKAAETLETRYRALLPDKKMTGKDRDHFHPASIAPSLTDGDLDELEEERAESEANAFAIVSSQGPKLSKVKLKLHTRTPTAPASAFHQWKVNGRAPSTEHHSQTSLYEHQPEAESITIIASHGHSPSRSNISTGPISPCATRLTGIEDATSKMDMLQVMARASPPTARESIFASVEPPSTSSEVVETPAGSLMEIDQNIESVAISDVQISAELAQKERSSHQRKRQRVISSKLETESIDEQRKIRIDGLPEFSPTGTFFHEYLTSPPELNLSTPIGNKDDVTVLSGHTELVAQLESITLSAREESVSQPQPPKRRPGRPRKIPLPENALHVDKVKRTRSDRHKVIAEMTQAERPSSTPVLRLYDSSVDTIPIPSMSTVPRIAIEDAYYIPTGPGRHPPIPCIIAASRHNDELGRKSGRFVKAFGSEVPPFDEKEYEFELPYEIIDEIQDARDGPGAEGMPDPVPEGHHEQDGDLAGISIRRRGRKSQIPI